MMGQAKRRGTKEQRVQQAVAREAEAARRREEEARERRRQRRERLQAEDSEVLVPMEARGGRRPRTPTALALLGMLITK